MIVFCLCGEVAGAEQRRSPRSLVLLACGRLGGGGLHLRPLRPLQLLLRHVLLRPRRRGPAGAGGGAGDGLGHHVRVVAVEPSLGALAAVLRADAEAVARLADAIAGRVEVGILPAVHAEQDAGLDAALVARLLFLRFAFVGVQ